LDKENILVVGSNSFIGKKLVNFDCVSHDKFHKKDLSKYETVINCSLDPLYKNSPYSETSDFDFHVGQKSIKNNCHYVMLSTSKIYGNNEVLQSYNENSTTNPFDYYSENKLITENKLLSNFKEKVTILRMSNIFGFEVYRSSFVGYIMTQMITDRKVKLTIPENNKRDFLFIDDAVDIIEKVCYTKPNGIFNLSSNEGYDAIKVINNLIWGYCDFIRVENYNQKPDRQFIMDNTKLKNALQIDIGPFNFDKTFKTLGEELARFGDKCSIKL
jgi:nucleoside-diphosphate-sugar epimerase